MSPNDPYSGRPPENFWRRSVSDRHFSALERLWRPMPLGREDRLATAGSCFAQHIGAQLVKRGAGFMDMEPAPPLFSSIVEARRWGYGVFSCRYGNIYTTRQLVQLFDEAFGTRTPIEGVWERNGRFYDAMRPSVHPVGEDSAESTMLLRRRHLEAVRRMFTELDVFIFTLGLTETWEYVADGTVYPVAPGVLAGSYDPQRYAFRNLSFEDIQRDLKDFCMRLSRVNANARILLTVSPVPLNATATDNHILVASTHSKSVLRAVAGEMAGSNANIFYFPAFEIICSHPSRAMYFEPDLRNVSEAGVGYVMHHFFSGTRIGNAADNVELPSEGRMDLICDEDEINGSF
jgi:hypothetical protein